MIAYNILGITNMMEVRLMTTDALDVKVKLLRGFSDKTRIQILGCIKDQEKIVSEIVSELKGNQSNISQHLACLKGCGLIVGRQEGKYIYYSLRDERVKELLYLFDVVLTQIHSEIDNCEDHLY
jgi:DNA-binding transcriptional ArsR family regulator